MDGDDPNTGGTIKMATALQALTDVQALPLSSCPLCGQQQTQAEAASWPDRAPAPSLVPGSKPGAGPKLSSHPDEKTSLFQRREC
ncbi:hypothetical protein A4R35_03730 [Thermogemmatispora tikiterensis]|uniref:Uncharacterized protein n=1 Tax=Thermogemmatispora tikiterensis TaxID=1825093 RepID=A0A328VCV6_9CHLR|nr:hypothetical protein A4R35_03730 [Thermogemmatispora tikiterensis]